jgi:hypothetical protein
MPIPRSVRRWLRLPGRVALILGLGALSTAGARADAPERTNLGSSGDILVRSEGGKIYFSENGRETELRLGTTPERNHLLRLLEGSGPAGIKLDRDPRLIMSGGGGTGFSLWDIKKSFTDKPPPAPPDPPQATTPSGSSKAQATPRDRHSATDKKD